MKKILGLTTIGLAGLLLVGCGDAPAVSPAWQAMCEAFCTRYAGMCFPGISVPQCQSLCLSDLSSIPCEADPSLLDECLAGIESLSCAELADGELPRVCNHMCTGGLCEGVNCDDENECTDDVCNPADGSCEADPFPDGTSCAGGGCVDGMCTSGFPCTERGVRAAIAAGGGPHTFSCNGPTTVTIQEEIVIDSDVILDGEGNLTVDGNNQHRIFSVASDVNAELNGFILTGGHAEWSEYERKGGGAIFNEGTLTIMNCAVSNNTSVLPPGLPGIGAGIDNRGTVTLANTSVSDNEGSDSISSDGTLMVTHSSVSENSGVGITNGGGVLELSDSTVSNNGAGGLFNGGTATLTRVTVSENTGNGGVRNSDVLTATDSVFSENDTATSGGGIYSDGEISLGNCRVAGNSAGNGGGIYNYLGTATLIALTVSGNSANEGGGVSTHGGTVTLIDSTVSQNSASWRGGGLLLHGEMTLINSTVSGNDAEQQGGGILLEAGITMLHTTVSRNQAGGEPDAIRGFGTLTVASSLIDGDCALYATVSDGYNIESPGNTCGFDEAKGDQFDVTEQDLNLGPLANNGGPTQTHELGAGSFAIDHIPAVDCEVAEDQRGEPRPETGGTMCDVGAFEVQP